MHNAPLIILTWHSINVITNSYSGNDPRAFSEDIKLLDSAGWSIQPLDKALARLASGDLIEPTAVLTVDDGSILDFEDFEHPTCGKQTSLFHSLQRFARSTTNKQEHKREHNPHLTSFVIASPEARAELDRRDYMSLNVWPDHWWSAANESGLMSIESHSWDHNHASLELTVQRDNQRGDFRWIETETECRAEIDQASDYIELKAGRRPEYFAYPYGQSSDYLRHEYFPANASRLGLKAALSCEPEPVTSQSDRWFLPRYIFGRDWKQPDDLLALLRDASR